MDVKNQLENLAPWGAAAGTLLIWALNRRAAVSDKKETAAVGERAAYLEGTRALLTELRASLAEEKQAHLKTRADLRDLENAHLRLQQASNELILKYQLVCSLRPNDERFPPLDPPTGIMLGTGGPSGGSKPA